MNNNKMKNYVTESKIVNSFAMLLHHEIISPSPFHSLSDSIKLIVKYISHK